MSRKSIADLIVQATGALPDNTTGMITPAGLRTLVLDLLDTINTGYATLVITNGTGVPVNTAYSVITWTSAPMVTSPYEVSLASGLVTRNTGPAVARVSFSIDAMAPVNNVTTFALFVDGVETAWAISNTSSNANGYQAYAFSAIVFSDSPNPTYQIQVKSSSSNNLTLNGGVLAVENVWVGAN